MYVALCLFLRQANFILALDQANIPVFTVALMVLFLNAVFCISSNVFVFLLAFLLFLANLYDIILQVLAMFLLCL